MNRPTSALSPMPPSSQSKGRLRLLLLILTFAIPFIAAKVILTQHWYQSGVTNNGLLIEPRLTYQMIDIENNKPNTWHMGFLIPKQCDERCKQQIYLLSQSYKALGKDKPRVVPILYVAPDSDLSVVDNTILTIMVNKKFTEYIHPSDYLLVDPLGQLVMKYPDSLSSINLMDQHKAMLNDFRRLLKLSRVG